MAYDLQEQEQLDQLKSFWKHWRTPITTAIIVSALAYSGYRGYEYYQNKTALEAMPLFEALEKATEDVKADAKNPQLIADLSKKLTQDYGKTVHAQLGALLAAKAQADLGKHAESDALYQWVIDHGKDESYQGLARLYLAGSLIEAKKADKAIVLLPANSVPKGFEALYADRRGDALAENKKTQEALTEYQKAWDLSEKAPNLREIIELKTNALGAEIKKPDDKAKTDNKDNKNNQG